jgi:tetratricopeptide (TPR) repeat protein
MFGIYYTAPDDVRDLFASLVEEANGAINWAHLCLGELVARRFASTVLTTNFDQLVLAGLVRAGVLPVVCDGLDSLNRIAGSPRHPQLVELHGSRHTYLLRNSPEDVASVGGDPKAVTAIQTLLHHATTFVVVGYGGRENGVMDLLVEAGKVYQDKNLFWVTRASRPDDISDKAKEFMASSRNGGLMLGQDADEFFLELCKSLEIGSPRAISDPLATIDRWIIEAKHSSATHDDIRAAIDTASARLQRFRECSAQTSALDPLAESISKIREARLAGKSEEAFRLAEAELAKVEPLAPMNRELIEEAALAALDWGERSPDNAVLGKAIEHSRFLAEASQGDIEARVNWMIILGNALSKLGERESGTEKLGEAVAAKIYGSTDAVVAKLVAALGARGELRKAEDAGLERTAIIALAQRLHPERALDFDRAIIELEYAVTIALDVIARGERGTDAFVNGVLARVAELTRKGEFDEGAREVDAALVELGRCGAEEKVTGSRSRIVLLEAGIELDSLRRDAGAVARRVEAVAAVEAPGERPAWTGAFRERWDRYFEEGASKGVNFSLEIAIRLARRMLETALDADERGVAANLLSNALATLGQRESGTARLDEAVAAYREALKEWTRERVPLQWALTQNNLGNVLRALGERESGAARLEEAVAAFREALEERTRERVPLDWAMTQNNLGAALSTLGERESGTARLDEAVAAYREALKERTRERVPLQWAMTQTNLGTALFMLGERESGTARLEEAVAAYGETLKEWTRERVPLQWAGTQNNLGNALLRLGERESGQVESIRRLNEAVAAFRAALKEHTRQRVPPEWATTQNNLGEALRALGERESGQAESIRLLDKAVAAFRAALEEWTIEAAPYWHGVAQGNLARAQALLDARRKGGGK